MFAVPVLGNRAFFLRYTNCRTLNWRHYLDVKPVEQVACEADLKKVISDLPSGGSIIRYPVSWKSGRVNSVPCFSTLSY